MEFGGGFFPDIYVAVKVSIEDMRACPHCSMVFVATKEEKESQFTHCPHCTKYIGVER